MAREIPENLKYFLKNALKDMDDGYEYSSELRRILNSDECQSSLRGGEIEKLKEYADETKKVGEITYYTEERLRKIEEDFFGSDGIEGFLGIKSPKEKPQWPF